MSSKVSIIIPCYRQGHLLSQAVDSSLGQTHPAVEVVVVNDGSDDDTEAIARLYDDRIRYLAKPNGGLSSARNAGIMAATGTYLLFLDADDLIHPQAVEWLVAAARGRVEVIAAMGFRRFNTDPQIGITGDRPPVSVADPLRHMITWSLGPSHSFLCSAAMARAVGGFEESLRSCEDWDFWLRLVMAGAKIVTVPNVGAFYRDTPGSMSKNATKMLTTRAEVLLRLHAAIVKDPELVNEYGHELIGTEQRVLKRLIACRIASPIRSSLFRAIHELEDAGVTIKRSWPKRILRSLFGDAAESMVMNLQRIVDRKAVATLRADFF